MKIADTSADSCELSGGHKFKPGGIFCIYIYIHMSYSLNSLKGGLYRGYIGDYIWDYYRGY